MDKHSLEANLPCSVEWALDLYCLYSYYWPGLSRNICCLEFLCLIITFSFQIQNKPEKKPGTPLQPTATFPSSPQPLSVVPHVNNVVNAPLSINIPQFYFPEGLPDACSNHEQTLSKIETAFMDIEDQKADIYEMGKIAKVM